MLKQAGLNQKFRDLELDVEHIRYIVDNYEVDFGEDKNGVTEEIKARRQIDIQNTLQKIKEDTDHFFNKIIQNL